MDIPLLTYAASNGYAEIAEFLFLLQHGADPMERDGRAFSGYTPLHYAVANNDHEIVTLLLKAGADLLVLTAGNDASQHGR